MQRTSYLDVPEPQPRADSPVDDRPVLSMVIHSLRKAAFFPDHSFYQSTIHIHHVHNIIRTYRRLPLPFSHIHKTVLPFRFIPTLRLTIIIKVFTHHIRKMASHSLHSRIRTTQIRKKRVRSGALKVQDFFTYQRDLIQLISAYQNYSIWKSCCTRTFEIEHKPGIFS